MHRRRALTLFAGMGLCPLCASVGLAVGDGHHWTYEGAAGPDKWGSILTSGLR
jgi:carbonic anhydrase